MQDRGFPFHKPLSPLQKVQGTLTELIDFNLAIAAMCMEKGVFNHEQLFRMEGIIKDARRKLGSTFTIEDGMAAVRAAFKIEISRDNTK